MKHTILGGAIAAALVASAPAHALAPDASFDIQIFISGASAQQRVLGALVSQLCVAGTEDFYRDGNTAATDLNAEYAAQGRAYRAYACTLNGANSYVSAQGLGGKNVLIHNRAAGGSGQGVVPVGKGQAITRMPVTTARCVQTPANPKNWVCSNASATLVSEVPDAGVSDVEPALFVGDNVPSGLSALTAGELANLEVKSQFGVVFGIAVTNNVPLTTLSRSQIASILNGTYNDWSQVGLAAGEINVARRVAGSGTQAAANLYFNNIACSQQGAVPFVTTLNDGPRIFEGSGSGNVTAKLDEWNGAGVRGLGLISLENAPGASSGYKFVNINGVAPTVANAQSGDYDYWFEQTFQWRKSGAGAPGGDDLKLLNALANASQDPAVVTATGIPGVTALAGTGSPAAKGSRLGNSCNPLRLFE